MAKALPAQTHKIGALACSSQEILSPRPGGAVPTRKPALLPTEPAVLPKASWHLPTLAPKSRESIYHQFRAPLFCQGESGDESRHI